MKLFQTVDIDDYATRAVPESHRRWHWTSVSNVLIGVSTAMFFLAWGGKLTNDYGTLTTIVAMVIGTIILGGAGYLFAQLGARHGLSSNLLSREPYGRYGSAIATFIYAFNYIMFFAFESAIMLTAVTKYFPAFPAWAVYLLFVVFMIVLAVYGMALLSRIMWLTLPIYILGLILLFVLNPDVASVSASEWLSAGPDFSGIGLGGAVATAFALISVSTQGADYGRMLRPQDTRIGSIAMGFGVLFVTLCVVGLLGSYLATALDHTNPGQYFTTSLGAFGLVVILLTQIRINVVNMYSGSLEYSNSLQMIHVPLKTWVRVACAAFVAVVGVWLVAVGVYQHMLQVLTIEGIFIMAWGASVISYPD